MALLTFPHVPLFVSYDSQKDLDELREVLPHEAFMYRPELLGLDNMIYRGLSWCRENCTGRYARRVEGDHAVFSFENKNDAMVFKLTCA
jgi:hypothetical protein